MINFMAGTVRDAVKLTEMDNKWRQKKDEIGKKKLAELDPQTRQIKQYEEDMKKIRENNQMASIDTKLKAGAGLTQEEIDYLKKNNPAAYREYLEVKQEKEAYEKRLKTCKTKEEVEKLKLTQMGNFMAEAKAIANNPNIPKDKKKELMEKLLKKTMGVQEKHMEFTMSEEYRNLPTEEEIAEKEQKAAGQTGQVKEQTEPEEQTEFLEVSEDKEDAETALEEISFEMVKEELTEYLRK